MDLKEESILGPQADTHWYYVSKGRALRSLLGRVTVPELLDVGAGSGIFARQMLDAGVCAQAVCVDPNYGEERTEDHGGRAIVFRRKVERTTQGLILMIDVLEHVPDDLELLRSYTDSAPAGARVLVSVPAFPFLWSAHDVFLGHYRRYTLRRLEDLMRRAGLEIVASRYYFATLFPLVGFMRVYDRWRLASGRMEPKSALSQHTATANAVLVWLHNIERISLFRINRLAGLSAFCLARRP